MLTMHKCPKCGNPFWAEFGCACFMARASEPATRDPALRKAALDAMVAFECWKTVYTGDDSVVEHRN
jgi:hypothetical protein